MRMLIYVLAIAFATPVLSAQSLVSPDSITPPWVQRHLLGGIDAMPSGYAKTWACVKSWPEVTRALIAVYQDSSAYGLPRANALLTLGSTEQDSAYSFLVRTLERTSTSDPLRLDMILALGNGPNPPGYVYERLESLLTSGPPADRGWAARSLSDIRSARAEAILQKARVGETSSPMIQSIDRSLARFQKVRARTVLVCDSSILHREN